MNFYKRRFKKELVGLPPTKIKRLYNQYAKCGDLETAVERINDMKIKYEAIKTKARERERRKNGTVSKPPVPLADIPELPDMSTGTPAEIPVTIPTAEIPVTIPTAETQPTITPTEIPAEMPTIPAAIIPARMPVRMSIVPKQTRHNRAMLAMTRAKYDREVKAYEIRLRDQREAYRAQQREREQETVDRIEMLRLEQVAERNEHRAEIDRLKQESYEPKRTPSPEPVRRDTHRNERETPETDFHKGLICKTFPNDINALSQVISTRLTKRAQIAEDSERWGRSEREHRILLDRETNKFRHEIYHLYKGSLNYNTPSLKEFLLFLGE